MSRPLIFDGYCGKGLVYDGLYAAGWQPVGMDIRPQPEYPGPFILGDVLAQDDRFFGLFSAFWFSPPCLKDTVLHRSARREQEAHGRELTQHPDLITPTQRLVDRLGKPFVIENVGNCRVLRNPVTLCGSMFDLGVDDGGRRFHLERHRLFETNWPLDPPGPCRHQKPVVGVYGGHARIRAASAGGRGTRDPWTRSGTAIMHEAMGVARRVPGAGLDQGIPPAYARWVGEQLLDHMEMERWAA